MVDGQQPELPADLAAGAAKATGGTSGQCKQGRCFFAVEYGLYVCQRAECAEERSRSGEVEAAKWFRKAADQGYAPAQYNLGLLYLSGQGVAQSNLEALQMLPYWGAPEQRVRPFAGQPA
jgi:TPR repeat protein